MQATPATTQNMTTQTPELTTQTPEPTTPNPLKPTLLTFLGVIIGVLSMVYAYFHSGHIPTSTEVTGLLAGAGITASSVVGFLVHHLGINKAMLYRDIAALTGGRTFVPVSAVATTAPLVSETGAGMGTPPAPNP